MKESVLQVNSITVFEGQSPENTAGAIPWGSHPSFDTKFSTCSLHNHDYSISWVLFFIQPSVYQLFWWRTHHSVSKWMILIHPLLMKFCHKFIYHILMMSRSQLCKLWIFLVTILQSRNWRISNQFTYQEDFLTQSVRKNETKQHRRVTQTIPKGKFLGFWECSMSGWHREMQSMNLRRSTDIFWSRIFLNWSKL